MDTPQESRLLDADERKGLVRFLRCLDALDQGQGHVALNCGSTFEYLVRKLHLPEGTAWARVNAMRLTRRFPLLEAALEDGRLNPTQLLVLGPVLTPENVEDLVRRATHLTKAKTKELVVCTLRQAQDRSSRRRSPPTGSASSRRPRRGPPPLPRRTPLQGHIWMWR